MRKLPWFVAILSLTALLSWAVVALSAKSKTFADVTSPSGDWRVVVRGTQLLFRGIEVTAEVHTHDGRRVSLGVIDLRQEWPETEYVYQPHETLHTRIDEVKAVVGGLDGRVLIRDDYFPNENFFISGTIDGERVNMRIGKVDNTSINFMSGLNLLDRPSTSINILDLPRKLAAGKVFAVNEDEFDVHGPSYFWRDSRTNQQMNGRHNKNFSMRLEVQKVTNHVVIGELIIVGKDPRVDLSGRFRLVNTITPFSN